ncbi:hypothetical protein ABT337_00640 [Saccharopolyspora hirsuta]|uniref:BRCT domain-containing protein n=1 Tax=Saccharopolyspora hirsuta TaxID=1837 RepID=A0A5M7BY51_SACHI|nr:hypothetical protein [Saccharopolyspora hirsuta]KAA5831245.1 hypothetical protein F1721_21115 [Saccharopolyspora hirsuta]
MIVKGSAVVLAGRFTEVSRAEAKRGLEALGAEVIGSVSARTDLVFAGADAGAMAELAAAQDVPVHDEAALLAVLSSEPAEFAGIPDPSAGPDAALERLRGADWSAFAPVRDTVPLREALEALEQMDGITEAHRLATQRMREAGAVLRHPDVHRGDVVTHALSPCGRYLAIGSWCGGDYDRGGAVQIWEVATARCVNVIDGIRGGAGWPGTARNLQWSSDGSRIAAEFDTNLTGVWDPHRAEAAPIAEAFFFASAKPTGFALAPDGERACVFQETPHAFQSSIVSMLQGRVSGPPDGEELGPEPIRFSTPLSAEARAVFGADEEAGILFDRAFWSRDGARIYGDIGQGRWAVSLDVEQRGLAWFRETGSADGPPPEWSLDERLLAHQDGGRLVISDALTGEPTADLAGYPGASFLSWGPGGRLAVVVSPDPDVAADPVVGIVDGTTGVHRYDLPVDVDSSDPHRSDGLTWAWSPDGERAACATATGRIEVWALGEQPERLHELDGLRREVDGYTSTFDLVWASHDVLIAIGRRALRFFRATTGEIIGDFAFDRAPRAPRPLDLGSDLLPDPVFALDGETWAAAFESGAVIVEPGREDALPDLLAWSVANRFAWPVRWGDLDIFPDARAAARAEPRLAPFVG